MIEMSELQSRIKTLNESSSNRAMVNVKPVYERLMKDNKSLSIKNVNFCLEHWQELGDTDGQSFTKLLEMFDKVCEMSAISEIARIGTLIAESSTPKLRDGMQTQEYIKRKIARFKTKLHTRIEKNVDMAKTAVADTIGGAKENLDKNTSQIKSNISNGLPSTDKSDKTPEEEKKEEIQKEFYQKIYEKVNNINTCDRMISNYNKLSKRFNIDKIVQEHSVDARDTVCNICACVETYKLPFKVRYNIALETCLFGLYRNVGATNFTKSYVVECVTDFYLMTEDCNKDDIVSSVCSNSFFTYNDIKDLQYLTNVEPDDYMESAVTEGVADKILEKAYNLLIKPFDFMNRGKMDKVDLVLASDKALMDKAANEKMYKLAGLTKVKSTDKEVVSTVYGYIDHLSETYNSFADAIVLTNDTTGKEEFILFTTYRGDKTNMKRMTPFMTGILLVNKNRDGIFIHILSHAGDKELNGKIINIYSSKDSVNENSYGVFGSKLGSVLESESKDQVKIMINKFKMAPTKSLEGLKSLITKMYTNSPEQISKEVPNLLGWIRVAFVSGTTFAINPVLGIFATIVDQSIAMHMKRKETKKILDGFKSEKEKAQKKLDKTTNEEVKSRYEKYIKELDRDIDKINRYYENLHTDEENTDRAIEDNGDDFDMDFSFDESTLLEMAYIIETENMLSDIIDSGNEIDTVIDMVNNSIDKMDISLIDSMTEFVHIFGTRSNAAKCQYVLEAYRQDLRKSESMNKFLKIDCLNDNIAKLKTEAMEVLRSDDSTYVFAKLCAIKEVMESVSLVKELYSSNAPGSILEASFTNRLALASEKLKKGMVKMSDAEKTASKNVDVTMNNLKKAIERATTNDNREAIIKGSVLPSASKIVKMALVAGATWMVNPAVAVIGTLGYLGTSSKMKAKERQMILDEIEIELKMVDRYLKMAEEKNDLKAQRELLKTQRELERQHQRIKYKMKVEFGQETDLGPGANNDD